jgi:signal transduction histidine kinase
VVKLGRDTINRSLAALTLLVLCATAFELAWVESRFRREADEAVRSIVALFQDGNVLNAPTDLRPDFSRIEDLARKAETSAVIRHVYVAKIVSGRERPVLLHPFYYSALHPDWIREFESLRREILLHNHEKVGALYFDLDLRVLHGIRISMAITLVLLLFALVVLIARVFTQERVLHATGQVLEENQRALIRMERLSLAGLLTANIFHDIRKPITNIKHEVADLTDALGDFAGATRALHNMREQIDLFFDILRDLNIERFVRSDESDEEYVDLNRIVEQSLRLVQYERGATRLDLRLSDRLPLVLAHPYRLVQVFSNVILNAYQALEGHGSLRIVTRASDGKAIAEFIDDGPGISESQIAAIFSPFYSTKSKDTGTGLGLYIARSIAQHLGGDIRVESQPGKGATFRIELPTAE